MISCFTKFPSLSIIHKGVNLGNHEIMYLIFSYVIGSIPTGFIIFWHSKKDDIRKEGSGNIGATNILRTCGGKAAIATLFIDVLKGAIPVIYGLIHFKYPPLILGAGTLAIIGHIFPVWLKFQGGKGVATFAGVSAAYMAAPDGILVFPVFAFFFIGTMIYSGLHKVYFAKTVAYSQLFRECHMLPLPVESESAQSHSTF